MGISADRESKIKSILGGLLAVGSLIYSQNLGALQGDPVGIVNLIGGIFGAWLAATGPSATK